MKESTVWSKASEVAKNGKVTARINELKKEIVCGKNQRNFMGL